MEPDELLERLREAPERAAIVLDVDGVLAPIVDRPEDARVPDETRVELRRLNGKYALVACVSGRAGDDARRIVGLDELVYVGEHGLELDPEAPAWSSRLRDVRRRASRGRSRTKGSRSPSTTAPRRTRRLRRRTC